MERINQAAKYYLGYQGLPTTLKRVEKLLNLVGSEAVLRMAIERGFNA